MTLRAIIVRVQGVWSRTRAAFPVRLMVGLVLVTAVAYYRNHQTGMNHGADWNYAAGFRDAAGEELTRHRPGRRPPSRHPLPKRFNRPARTPVSRASG
jgi:hypothetical protein